MNLIAKLNLWCLNCIPGTKRVLRVGDRILLQWVDYMGYPRPGTLTKLPSGLTTLIPQDNGKAEVH